MNENTNPETTLTDAEWAQAVEQMRTAGKRQGTSDAAWLCDGNTTQEAARALLERIENCELDYSPPFSGEWAGSPTVADVIGNETDVDPERLDPEKEDELAQAFEEGYGEGYCAGAEEIARFYAAD